MAADGIGVHETARQWEIWAQTVRRWRGRWNGTTATEDLAVRLADAPRPGVASTVTAEQICAIVALACAPPEAAGVPVTPWSQSALAPQAVARGLVPGISPSSVGRL